MQATAALQQSAEPLGLPTSSFASHSCLFSWLSVSRLQRVVELPSLPRGCHVITRQLLQQVGCAPGSTIRPCWQRCALKTRELCGLRGHASPHAPRQSTSYASTAAPAGGKAPICHYTQAARLRRGPARLHPLSKSQVPELAEFEVGLANLFVQHTSASLTINENASPGVVPPPWRPRPRLPPCCSRRRRAAHALHGPRFCAPPRPDPPGPLCCAMFVMLCMLCCLSQQQKRVV